MPGCKVTINYPASIQRHFSRSSNNLASTDMSIFFGGNLRLIHLAQNLTPSTPTAKHSACEGIDLKVLQQQFKQNGTKQNNKD